MPNTTTDEDQKRHEAWLHGIISAIVSLKYDNRHDAASFLFARMTQPDESFSAIPKQRETFLRLYDEVKKDRHIMW